MNRYPLWRYLLIIFLVVLAFVYALPNFYGEDYAIQVQPKAAVAISATVATQIENALKKQKIPFKSIKQQKTNSVLVRFTDSEDQLRSRDVLQATLGDKYAVALNLAARTPKWLQSIGAKPMKLGLDLSGGIHFLLKVDVKTMLKQRMTADIHAFGNQLRSKKIRYAGIATENSDGLLIRFRNSEDRDNGVRTLKRNFPDYQFINSDKGYDVSASLRQNSIIKLEQNAVTQNLTILRNRVNDIGVAEPVIRQQGKDQISVDLPGIQDTARAKKIMGKVATIRLQMVDTEHDAAHAAQTGIIPFGDSLYKFENRPILLKNRVVLSGRSILNASTIIGEDGRPAVSIRAGGAEVAFFNKVTGENIGKPMATVYVEIQTIKKLVNGKVVIKQHKIERIINVATIQSALGNSFQITGLESMRYAKDLALLLRSGAYVAPLTYIQERLVGPSVV